MLRDDDPRPTTYIRAMQKELILKYRRYEQSVQSPDSVIEFVNKEFRRLNRRRAFALREDFCGTGWLACEWVRQGPRHQAVGVDLSAEPIAYGLEQHFAKLTAAQQKRMKYLRQNVQAASGRFDIIAALNFSYCVFKARRDLLAYFTKVHASLKAGGVFFIDLFGGTETQIPRRTRIDYGSLAYYWECQEFNPIRNEGLWAIHFKPRGERTQKNAFIYDWRIWSAPELRDILHEAGFSQTIVYAEGDDTKGGGDGVFYPTEWDENCNVWHCYIAARK